MNGEQVLLVGASCRAAAEALVRCGYQVKIWDLFADRDTCDLGPTTCISSFTREELHGVFDEPTSWLLPCGGLENHPELWRELAGRHRLLGPTADQLQKLRDPFWLQEQCKQSSLVKFPTTLASSAIIRNHRSRWIRKSYKSGGGLQIRPYHDSCPQDYLQRIVSGAELGLVVSLMSERCELIGATRPLREQVDDCRYQGSIGPIQLTETFVRAIEGIISQLHVQLGFQGLLQMDMIFAKDDAYLLEINPRWSAGMELLELVRPGYMLSKFLDADRLGLSCENFESIAMKGPLKKKIEYAQRDVTMTQQMSDLLYKQRHWSKDAESKMWYRLADIPQPGTKITTGCPLYTLLMGTIE